jgi:hypothetical protein
MNVKTVLTVALVCGGLASLGGCASMGKSNDSSALTSGINDNVDLAYVAQVNQEANRHFATVIWVNPPQKTLAEQHN